MRQVVNRLILAQLAGSYAVAGVLLLALGPVAGRAWFLLLLAPVTLPLIIPQIVANPSSFPLDSSALSSCVAAYPICATATWIVRCRVDRRRGWVTLGRCHRCGYDLQATPDRCPECGAEPS